MPPLDSALGGSPTETPTDDGRLCFGRVVMMKRFKSFHNTPLVHFERTYGVMKGKAYAFVLIGAVDIEKMHEFDANAVMEANGWKFTDPAVASSSQETPQ